MHKGHLKAIKWNISQGGRLIIVIGSMQADSAPDNPLGFKERKAMVKACLSLEGVKDYRLVGIQDFNNDALWAKKLLKLSKAKIGEVIVSSLNPWTLRACKSAGIAVVENPVFLNGLSATFVRKNIRAGKPWRRLVPESVFDYLKDSGGDKKIKACSDKA